MQRVADLVDGEVFRFDKRRAAGYWVWLCGEGVGLEEEADFVGGGEEVVVADVGVVVGVGVVAGGEAGEGVGVEGEVGEEGGCFGEEGGYFGWGEVVGDDEVAVLLEGVDLG